MKWKGGGSLKVHHFYPQQGKIALEISKAMNIGFDGGLNYAEADQTLNHANRLQTKQNSKFWSFKN